MYSLGQYVSGVTGRAEVVRMHRLPICVPQTIPISSHYKSNTDSPVLVILMLE